MGDNNNVTILPTPCNFLLTTSCRTGEVYPNENFPLSDYSCIYQLTSCEVQPLSGHLCPDPQPSVSSMPLLPYHESSIH